ncbi:SAM-dependent methyltransferase [Actinomadura rudentiformis]|uniref:SAM-dependent methyltransferase n=1 Tax=Actinomadura rudentiformis TaxID=359158 RepID=A0A6H9YPA9_9ACTN|nr:SAM-dependent methyltransferase [Actinomadura rudentiformis]KAB2348045.1 SAM-dependent methyltransferase [Actinomadura rudentiformis]
MDDDTQSHVNSSVPHSARIWNYWLGGKDNYPVDQAVGEEIKKVFPGIVQTALADRAFLGRAVWHLVDEVGIRQFLDIGTGLPTVDNTHEVAQRIAPECRIVYVDNDPLALTHARALLNSSAEGATSYIDADLRDPEHILAKARETLDFDRPIAIMLLGIVHFILDDEEAQTIIKRLMDAVPSGSHLAMTHACDFVNAEEVRANIREWNEHGTPKMTVRSYDQVSRLFAGLELVDPGLVSLPRWRPEASPWGEPPELPGVCALARKP